MFFYPLHRRKKKFNLNPFVKIQIIADFFVWVSMHLLTPIFAIFVLEKIADTTVLHVGIAVALMHITRSIFEIPVAILIDKTKSEKDNLYVLLAGVLLEAIAYMLYIFANSIIFVYFIQILVGFAFALSYPGWTSLFSTHTDKGKEGYEWSVYDVMIGIAISSGAALGGFIVNEYGFESLFIVMSTLNVIAFFFFASLRNKVK